MLAFASSYCPQDDCEDNENDNQYSAFFILSYPNSTDTTLILDQYLFTNNTNRRCNCRKRSHDHGSTHTTPVCGELTLEELRQQRDGLLVRALQEQQRQQIRIPGIDQSQHDDC